MNQVSGDITGQNNSIENAIGLYGECNAVVTRQVACMASSQGGRLGYGGSQAAVDYAAIRAGALGGDEAERLVNLELQLKGKGPGAHVEGPKEVYAKPLPLLRRYDTRVFALEGHEGEAAQKDQEFVKKEQEKRKRKLDDYKKKLDEGGVGLGGVERGEQRDAVKDEPASNPDLPSKMRALGGHKSGTANKVDKAHGSARRNPGGAGEGEGPGSLEEPRERFEIETIDGKKVFLPNEDWKLFYSTSSNSKREKGGTKTLLFQSPEGIMCHSEEMMNGLESMRNKRSLPFEKLITAVKGSVDKFRRLPLVGKAGGAGVSERTMGRDALLIYRISNALQKKSFSGSTQMAETTSLT
jgi:hypothetical protein